MLIVGCWLLVVGFIHDVLQDVELVGVVPLLFLGFQYPCDKGQTLSLSSPPLPHLFPLPTLFLPLTPLYSSYLTINHGDLVTVEVVEQVEVSLPGPLAPRCTFYRHPSPPPS